MGDSLQPVREAFRMVRLPANLRWSHWWDNMRITRWVRDFQAGVRRRILLGRLLGHEGRFAYRGSAGTREIPFNGRNAQFHALYDFPSGYEPETSLLLTRLAKGPGAFYDVGANWGYFSLLLATCEIFAGPILAFEPNPRVYSDLRRTVEAAGLAARIQTFNLGLGREAGELCLEEPDEFFTGVARLAAEGAGPRVPVRRLDEMNLPAPALIKLDVEGMETEVLAGARDLLRRHRPHVVFENFLDHRSPERTWAPIRLLRELDYELFNPALCFDLGSDRAFASYADPIADLLLRDPRPRTALVPVCASNRFLMGRHLNLLACARERLSELPEGEFIRADPTRVAAF